MYPRKLRFNLIFSYVEMSKVVKIITAFIYNFRKISFERAFYEQYKYKITCPENIKQRDLSLLERSKNLIPRNAHVK